MITSLIRLSLLLIFVIISASCKDNTAMNDKLINNTDLQLDTKHLNILASKKVFFGHQSVGLNIIDGISQLKALNPELNIDIKTSKAPDSETGPAFMHSVVGENQQPLLKIQEFENIIGSATHNKLDIAMLKFCYLDVDKNTDVDKLFSEYESAVYRLVKAHPDTIFVHFTVPLTKSETNLRNIVKKIIGRPDNNIARQQFNKKIIDKYGQSGRVFDLARIESTYPDGTRSAFKSDNIQYYSLVPEYASDNGHLNEIGAIIVAKELLTYMANL